MSLLGEALDLADERRKKGFPLITALVKAIKRARKKRRERRNRDRP